jgi:hypothetical protein
LNVPKIILNIVALDKCALGDMDELAKPKSQTVHEHLREEFPKHMDKGDGSVIPYGNRTLGALGSSSMIASLIVWNVLMSRCQNASKASITSVLTMGHATCKKRAVNLSGLGALSGGRERMIPRTSSSVNRAERTVRSSQGCPRFKERRKIPRALTLSDE